VGSDINRDLESDENVFIIKYLKNQARNEKAVKV
jgi:hypothetical protein